MNKFIQGLTILLLISITAAFSWLLWRFVADFDEVDASIQAALIGFSSVTIAALIAHYQTKKREINARLFADKRAGYTKIIGLIFDLAEAQRKKQKVSNAKMVGKMIDFKKALIIWGGPKAITAWNEFETGSGNPSGSDPSGKEVVERMEKILRAIREDLGHDDNTLEPGSLMALMIVPEDKDIVLGKN